MVQGRSPDKNSDFIVDSFGSLILPGHPGYSHDGKLLAANSLILKQFLLDKGMNAVKAVAGLGLNGVITRSIRVPGVSPGDLENMMKLEINDLLPVSPEEYSFDYKVMSEIEEDEQKYYELMVAAVNRKQVEQCAALLEMAGLKPVVIDILPNMWYRLFQHMDYRDTLVVDGGKDGTHLAIFKGKSLFMYADIPFVYNSGEDSDISALVGEMRGYLDFFSSRNFGKTVDGITVLGELAELPGLSELFSLYFSFPVFTGLAQMGPLSFKGAAAGFHERAAVYAGNLGLMMRGSKFRPPVETSEAAGAAASSGLSIGA